MGIYSQSARLRKTTWLYAAFSTEALEYRIKPYGFRSRALRFENKVPFKVYTICAQESRENTIKRVLFWRQGSEHHAFYDVLWVLGAEKRTFYDVVWVLGAENHMLRCFVGPDHRSGVVMKKTFKQFMAPGALLWVLSDALGAPHGRGRCFSRCSCGAFLAFASTFRGSLYGVYAKLG